MAIVRVMTGGREFRREIGNRLVIGRDMDCDVRVDDPKISRLHCLIERSGEEYMAIDLESHNGTMISGWPLTRQALKHGDVLDMGVASLQFLIREQQKASDEAQTILNEEEPGGQRTVDISPEERDPAAIPPRADWTKQQLVGKGDPGIGTNDKEAGQA